MRPRVWWVAVIGLAACHASPPANVGVVRFAGSITEARVAAFIAQHRDESVTRVVVDSPGGDVRSALALANWIVDRQADVEVENLCASSCANYLFAAGRRKIIDDRAIVVWHGSLLQKDFRDRCDASLHADADGAYCRDYRDAVATQQAFFARVRVDETITRLGQEPENFEAIWTVRPDTMARMGLARVEARADYASADDIRHFSKGPDDPEPIVVLGFDDAGRVVDLAR